MKGGEREEEGGLLCWIRGEDTVGMRTNTQTSHVMFEYYFLGGLHTTTWPYRLYICSSGAGCLAPKYSELHWHVFAEHWTMMRLIWEEVWKPCLAVILILVYREQRCGVIAEEGPRRNKSLCLRSKQSLAI